MVEVTTTTPKDTRHLLGQVQLYQQQMQGVLGQKELLNMQLMEIDKALESLEKTGERDVFKISGPVLIKTGKAEVKKELREKKEMISLRMKSLEKSESRMKEQMEELRERLSKHIKTGQQQAGD